MESLWKDIYKMCLEISSNSMRLIYSDNEIVDSLLENIGLAASNSKKAEKCTVQLNYLSAPENFRKLLHSDQGQQ